jgi:MoxR-like ATPase
MANAPDQNTELYKDCERNYGPRGPWDRSTCKLLNEDNYYSAFLWAKSCGVYMDKMKDSLKSGDNDTIFLRMLSAMWRDDTNETITTAVRRWPCLTENSTPFQPQTIDVSKPTNFATVKYVDEQDMMVLRAIKNEYATNKQLTALDIALRALIEQHAKPLTVNLTINNVPEYTIPATSHATLPHLLRTVAANVPAALVGPAGSGKTTACEQTADALSLDFYMQGAVSGSHEFLGFKDARGEYHTTPFRQAFECGGLFLADEIDGSDPAALLVINSAVANAFMNFPDRPQPIRRHPKFRMVAAANTYWTGGDRVYVGRSQLDGATLDRFAMIEWQYDEKLERDLTPHTREWTIHVQRVRAAVKHLGLRHIVSPRASINGGKLLAGGEQRHYVEKMVLYKGLSDDDTKRIMERVAKL